MKTDTKFWICVVGGMFNLWMFWICQDVPVLRPQSGVFLLTASAFTLGVIANYLNSKQFKEDE